MKPNKMTLLLLLQLGAILGLLWLELIHGEPQASRWILFTILGGSILLLFQWRRRASKFLERTRSELRRVLSGNSKTRLLAPGEPDVDELLFSINELIERLEAVQIEHVRSQAARKQLLSGISHDIRTPLTSIIGYIDALKDDVSASEQEKREYLSVIEAKASALKLLVDEMFTLAKLDADELTLNPETLDAAEMTREVLIDYLPLFKKEGIELDLRLPEHSCTVLADRVSLLRIIGNLLKNAAQHGKAGQYVGVEMVKQEQDYHLLISDRGPGIPLGEQERIFERMYRGEASRSGEHGGSGLGLAIAKALAEKNGGSLSVESEPWVRTVFRLSLPKQSRRAVKKLLRNE
ncbi:sensor histidine kinase [Paenibacillus turpanensis]|uniref:sensor histidine kinase n=1 Tax=Paenibacillus turpanensis TaxID=2689078 RepID=UPI00140E59AB|nr:HAMP domain-containing sensor histidine kinase [Paenibacillus turpanensis]